MEIFTSELGQTVGSIVMLAVAISIGIIAGSFAASKRQ
jgi:hypothetical protein